MLLVKLTQKSLAFPTLWIPNLGGGVVSVAIDYIITNVINIISIGRNHLPAT